MSTIICTECGAVFEGDDLRTAADAFFEHVREHVDAGELPEGDEQSREEPERCGR